MPLSISVPRMRAADRDSSQLLSKFCQWLISGYIPISPMLETVAVLENTERKIKPCDFIHRIFVSWWGYKKWNRVCIKGQRARKQVEMTPVKRQEVFLEQVSLQFIGIPIIKHVIQGGKLVLRKRTHYPVYNRLSLENVLPNQMSSGERHASLSLTNQGHCDYLANCTLSGFYIWIWLKKKNTIRATFSITSIRVNSPEPQTFWLQKVPSAGFPMKLGGHNKCQYLGSSSWWDKALEGKEVVSQ